MREYDDLFSSAQTLEELSGTIDRIIYTNDATGYAVAVLRLHQGGPEVTIVGPLAGVHVEDSLRCRGEYVEDKRYGRQFRVHSYEMILPTSPEAIERYLGSGAIRGIGKKYAKRLVEKFGPAIFEIIENAPERLAEVPGIGRKRIQTIVKSWHDQRVLRDIMLFLEEHAISPSLAPKIYAQYGSEAIEKLRKNPYQLALDIRGIGFKRADDIATKLRIPRECLDRVKAGCLYLLTELADEGHTYFPAEDFVEKAAATLDVSHDLVVDALNNLKLERHVVLEKLPSGDGAVYLRGLHAHEVGVARQLALIASSPKVLPRFDLASDLAGFEEAYHFQLAPEQRRAIEVAVHGGVMVITGGPGTGKTTIVRTILKILESHGLRVVLAAPTGRAAKRLQELTRHHASTIHRLLQYSPRDGGFLRNRQNPLRADFIVVDESSMVDISLAYHFLQAVTPRTSLILVGDVDQLPSVGPGNFLRDLIASESLPVVRLHEIFRQAQHSMIVQNAHRINQGKLPIIDREGARADFIFRKAETPEEALSIIKDAMGGKLASQWHVDPLKDAQVITPMHRGVIGAQNLNRELQALLNPRGEGIERGGVLFKVGDKVMQVANDYTKDVYNGDIGYIVHIDKDERLIKVRFDQRLVVYEFSELDQLELAYAVTVHKSQGSEYPAVVIPIHTSHAVMLQRNLLYTAVTRGRKLVYLVGQWKAIAMAVQNARSAPRFSALDQRLRQYIPAGSSRSQQRQLSSQESKKASDGE